MLFTSLLLITGILFSQGHRRYSSNNNSTSKEVSTIVHYNKQSEGGIRYNDPELNIDWVISGEPIVSEKDLELPFLQDLDIYN